MRRAQKSNCKVAAPQRLEKLTCVRVRVRVRVCVSRKRAKEQQRDEKNRIAQEQRNQKFNELLGLGEREGVS